MRNALTILELLRGHLIMLLLRCDNLSHHILVNIAILDDFLLFILIDVLFVETNCIEEVFANLNLSLSFIHFMRLEQLFFFFFFEIIELGVNL